MNSVVQCISGLKLFCQDAKQEVYSPILDAFKWLMLERANANKQQFDLYLSSLRLRFGKSKGLAFQDPNLQQCAQEFLTQLLEAICEEITDSRQVLGEANENLVDEHFSAEIVEQKQSQM